MASIYTLYLHTKNPTEKSFPTNFLSVKVSFKISQTLKRKKKQRKQIGSGVLD